MFLFMHLQLDLSKNAVSAHHSWSISYHLNWYVINYPWINSKNLLWAIACVVFSLYRVFWRWVLSLFFIATNRMKYARITRGIHKRWHRYHDFFPIGISFPLRVLVLFGDFAAATGTIPIRLCHESPCIEFRFTRKNAPVRFTHYVI